MREPHQILGVTPDATREQIRAAYRKLARTHHPDATGTPESAQRFARISTAYEQMLKLVDQPARKDSQTRTPPVTPGDQDTAADHDPEEIRDVYDSFFSEDAVGTSIPRRRRVPFTRRPGTHDLEIELPVSASEAAFGGPIRIPGIPPDRVIRINPGTSSGDQQRIPGFGVRGGGGHRGDLFVIFRVVPASGGDLDLER